MNLKDFITDCINLKLSASAVDCAIKSFGGNFLKKELPVLAIEVSNKEILLHMMQEAKNVHIYISSGILHVNALYEHSDHFPAARVYFMKSEDLLWIAQIGADAKQYGIKIDPVNDASFSRLIDDTGYAQRYESWHEKNETNASLFNNLLKGRQKNTAVKQGIWLSTDGRCIVCGVETDRMATSTVWGKSGMMIGMQLCLTHETESQKQSTLLNYLSKHLGETVIFSNTRPRTAKENFDEACETLKTDLNCTIVKVEEKTVTARRDSGISIIVRLHSPSNYAYNILSPEGKQLSRVDSANHHKVSYGPDHVHPDLRKPMKNVVEASFTYGNVGIDVQLLLKLIKEAEDKL